MSYNTDVVIDICNLSKCYEMYAKPGDRLKQLVYPSLHRLIGRKTSTYYREFWALRDISFQVRRGETMGIIGRNGGGKSTLLQIIAGTLAPTHGEAKISGRIAALLELGSGFNPEFTGRENVLLNGCILGFSQKEMLDRYDQIVEFADIGDFINQPVKTYSSGMFVRLAFAVQAHVDASIVIIDEALAVGDVFFRQKCYARLEQLKESGAAILLVSHAMSDIEQYCERAILLEKGQSIFIGKSTEATKHYYLLNQPTNSNISMVVPEKRGLQEKTLDIPDIWSNRAIFTDVSSMKQVVNGMAHCTRFLICNTYGEPCIRFSQGDVAIFYYEFLILKSIATPLGGIVLQNEKGIIVHGKGSLEYGVNVPEYIAEGTVIHCQQNIELKLQPGDYTFELGLATIDSIGYKNRPVLSHEDLYGQVIRICHVPNAGALSVGLRTGTRDGTSLTHHGIADLPGAFQFYYTQNTKNSIVPQLICED